ncbi:MAG: hypothetical protein WCX95_01480 [Candidatus Gracilibacteria bacterium]
MRKIFTKKQNKRLLIITMTTLLTILIFGILSLVAYQETHRYKACQEYQFNSGYAIENRIKGIDLLTGYYIDTPILSCASKVQKEELYYEDKGPYTETRSCEIGKENKTYIATNYERCPLGCFGGKCMSKCEAPNSENLFVKGLSYGVATNSTSLNSENNDPSIHYDHCTDSNNTENLLLSKYVSKNSCDPTNYLTSKVTECSDVCFDGACQKNDFRYCGDSDQEDKGQTQGTISYYDPISKEAKTTTDSCQDLKTVTEYFCGPDKMPHKIFLTCRNQCSNGQCLPQ